MLTGNETPSFSLDLCETAVEALGGELTSSPLGAAVLAVADEARASENLTAKWLARNGLRVRSMLVSYLESKLATSRKLGVVEDHVQTFLLRLVERDTLRPVLVEGKEPTPSVLRIWAYQSAATEMRGWGVDASLRTSRGAKTNRDRLADAGKKPEAPVVHVDTVREIRSISPSGETHADYSDPREASPEEVFSSRQTIEIYRKKIEGKLPASYVALFESLLESDRKRDAAKDHGLDALQMRSMISRIREAVLSA